MAAAVRGGDSSQWLQVISLKETMNLQAIIIVYGSYLKNIDSF